MTNQAYGWTCPKCGTVYAPWMSFCPTCAVPRTFTSVSTVGTAVMSGRVLDPSYYSNMGTVFTGPRTKTEAGQAQEAVNAWLTKGFEVRALINAAVDNLVERLYDAEEDDDDDE